MGQDPWDPETRRKGSVLNQELGELQLQDARKGCLASPFNSGPLLMLPISLSLMCQEEEL